MKTGPKKRALEDISPDMLRYRRPCAAKNHHGKNGFNICYKHGVCIACHYDYPEGQYDYDFPTMDQTLPRYTNKTKEQKKKEHIARVQAWNKAHPETFYKNQKNYNSKPETKAKAAARHKAQYDAMDPIEKKAKTKRQYERWKIREAKKKEDEANRILLQDSNADEMLYKRVLIDGKYQFVEVRNGE